MIVIETLNSTTPYLYVTKNNTSNFHIIYNKPLEVDMLSWTFVFGGNTMSLSP